VSEILGKPGEGFHAVRVFDLAILDMLWVFIFAFAYTYLMGVDLVVAICRVFVVAQMLHLFFWVETAFLVKYPFRLTCLILAICFYGSKFEYNEVVILIVYFAMVVTTFLLRH